MNKVSKLLSESIKLLEGVFDYEPVGYLEDPASGATIEVYYSKHLDKVKEIKHLTNGETLVSEFPLSEIENDLETIYSKEVADNITNIIEEK